MVADIPPTIKIPLSDEALLSPHSRHQESMNRILNLARATLISLAHVVTYLISPATLLIVPITKIVRPDLDVTVIGIAITIVSTIIISNARSEERFLRLFEWNVWSIAWFWLLHGECTQSANLLL
jgi:hypothetical protein